MGIGIPDFIAELGRDKYAEESVKVVGDLTLIASHYLLRVREYTIKRRRKNTKQTV